MTAAQFENRYTSPVLRWCASRSRKELAVLSLFGVLFTGAVDWMNGPVISLSVVYMGPIALAAWFVGPAYALAMSVLAVGVRTGGDIYNGSYHHGLAILTWNTLIRLIFYLLTTMLMVRLRDFQLNLDILVRERTEALTKEIDERRRLERHLMEVANRERRRIGSDLHDGLSQHLTGTALAAHALAERFAAGGKVETQDVRRIADLTEQAIALTRQVTQGLYPVDVEPEGLMQALENFAVTTSRLFNVNCRFECETPVLVDSQAVATHLYRIAQEAAGNAVKHGHAKDIVIALEAAEAGVRLTISDSGSGFVVQSPSGQGIGLQVMADRAKAIGGEFQIGRSAAGGAEVVCTLPYSDPPQGGAYD